jgi:hypothetical protein
MKLAILLLYLPALFTGKKKSGEGQSAHHRVINQVTALIVTLVSCFIILCAAFGIAAADRQLTFEQAASNWLSLYLNKSNISLYYNMAQLQSDLPAVSLIVMAASFLLFEFFRKGKEQNYMLWILACLLIAPTPMMELGILPYAMISFFQWCVLAGLGIQNCIFGDQADAVQAKIEAINAAAEPIAEKLTPAAAKTAQATEALQPQAETLQAEIEAINAAAEPIRYIENPLPLPKKHVKKEMDYQYPVEDKDMKYDVEVDDGDDYDIP